MPRVTRIGGQQITPAGIPTPRPQPAPSPASFGVQLGDTIARFGLQQFSQIMQLERQKANEVAVLAGENSMSEFEAEILLGEDGFLSKRGVDAIGELQDEVLDSFDQKVAEVGSGMATEPQRILFNRSAAAQRQRVMFRIQQHVFNERTTFDAEQTDAALVNTVNDAAANAGDERFVAESLARAEFLVTQWADRNGVSDDKREQRLLQSRSNIHTAVIDSHLAAGNDQLARAYFEESGAKQELTGKALQSAQEKVRVGSLRGEAQRQTDLILSETETTGEALDLARERLEGDIEELVVNGIKTRENEQQALELSTQRERMQGVIKLVNPEPGVYLGTKNIPSDVWTDLTLAERSSIENFVAAGTATGDVETNQPLFFRLRDLAVRDREAFAKVELEQFIGAISKADLNTLFTAQNSIINATSTTEKLDSMFTTDQVLRQVGAQYGIDLTILASDSKEELARKSRIRNQIDIIQRDEAKATGNETTKARIGEIANEVLMQEVVVPDAGFLFFDKRLSFGEITIKNVPADEQTRLRRLLRSTGHLGTDEEVTTLYFQELQLAQPTPVPTPAPADRPVVIGGFRVP